MPVIQKYSLEWVIANCTPELIATIVLVALTAWVVIRVNAVISKAYACEEAHTAGIVELKKQQRKVEQLIAAMPCVSKLNSNWLNDATRNGGQPPEPIMCQYHQAKLRGDQ